MEDIVLIKWIDSKGVTSGWEFKYELEEQKPVVIKSVGFVRVKNKDYIEIYQNNSDGQICGRMTIPKKCILNIRKL